MYMTAFILNEITCFENEFTVRRFAFSNAFFVLPCSQLKKNNNSMTSSTSISTKFHVTNT